MRKAILTIGNPLRGDDGAGEYAGELLEKSMDWKIFYGGDVPENQFHNIRVFNPDIIVVIDAASGIEPGSAHFIDLDEDPGYSFATHNIPVQLLMKCLRLDYGNVLFLGIGIDEKNAKEIGTGLSDKAVNGCKEAVEIVCQLDRLLKDNGQNKYKAG